MPVLTIACFQKLYAGKRRSSIVNNRYLNDIVSASKMPKGGHASVKRGK
ncbi:hypothetical protein HX037_10230 [Ignatzschineria indica]|nr:hypothetical protein [Ignatzschineria indica]